MAQPRKVKSPPPAPQRLNGLVRDLRAMKVGEVIEVPAAKRGSVYPSAKRAGVMVTTKMMMSNRGELVAYVWRVQ